MVVKKLKMLPVECVVRGYITGSGWKDYQATGKVSGIELPDGLLESEQLPEPLFTPSTKADVGHDEAIDFDGAAELIGDRELARAGQGRLDRAVRVRRRARARPRDHPRRHEVRARARCRRHADDRRRDVHDGLVALLAGRRLRARPRPAELRQAVRPRLGVVDRVGQEPARAGDPRRHPAAHRAEVHRGLRADHGRAVRRLAGAHRRLRRRADDARPRAGQAQGRDPRSPGAGGRARAAGARLPRRAATSRSGG